MGVFDGLSASAIVRGALVDIVVTFAGSIPLVALLAGEGAMSRDEAVSQQAIEQAMNSPEGLFWATALGLAATVVGALYGARLAGRAHVRHGGWVAVLSATIGALMLIATDGGRSGPLWFDLATLVAMLPAGLFGGWLAARIEGASHNGGSP